MHVAARKPGKCALCAFRTSTWTSVSAVGGGSKRCFRIRRHPAEYDHKDTDHVSVSGSISLVPSQRTKTGLDYFRPLSEPTLEQDATFTEHLMRTWAEVRESLSYWPTAAAEVRAWGVKSQPVLDECLASFQKELKRNCADAVELHAQKKDPPALIQKLRRKFIASGLTGLAAGLQYALGAFVLNQGLSKRARENQRSLADFRYPTEWYSETRTMQRKIHLHIGPTNSGKTYQALQRLEAAESGLYAGPLRLLAHEVYTRLNAKKKLCALITGEECRIPEGVESYLTSCTVEMAPLSTMIDVAVIDEIQMIGDVDRGWAWTRAFLGVKAKEVHLCGEVRTLPLIQQLCAMTGDSLEIHQYERLSPLKTMKSSLKGNLRNLEKGDAIILFSRIGIHTMKNEIERITGKRCAVVYGSLPPETRAQQAGLFNSPDNNYDFLVASDAVGMGLNLSIKRIILETVTKRDHSGLRTLQISEIKQLAGRAGRYRTAVQGVEDSITSRQEDSPLKLPVHLDIAQKEIPDTIGFVTTLQDYDMPTLENAMASEAPPLATAGIAAQDDIVTRFAVYFPSKVPLSYILLRIHEVCSVNPLFHLCGLREQLEIADAIEEYDLTLSDRLIFINSPANFRHQGIEAVIRAFAKCVADQSGGELLDIKEINLKLLDELEDVENKEYLRKLENLHSALTLYLWLSYRFAGVFRSQALAFHVKGILEEKIETCLSRVKIDPWKKKWMGVLQQRAASSSTSPVPKVTGAGEEIYGAIDPRIILKKAAQERNALLSFPNYAVLEQTDETGRSTWLATVKVIFEGEEIDATANGSSRERAGQNAAEALLQKISIGKSKLVPDSLHTHEISEEPHLALPLSWKGNVQTSILAERDQDMEGQEASAVG